MEETGAAELTVSQTYDTATEDYIRSVTQDRSLIGKIVVWLFAGAAGGSMLMVSIAAIFTRDGWQELGVVLGDILSSVILPVVTLVIGFYFGATRSNNQ